MSKKKELTQEEKEDNLIVDILLKRGMKSALDVTNTLKRMQQKVIQGLLDAEFNEFM